MRHRHLHTIPSFLPVAFFPFPQIKKLSPNQTLILHSRPSRNQPQKPIPQRNTDQSISCLNSSDSNHKNAAMKSGNQTALILKYFIFSLFLFIPLALVFIPYGFNSPSQSHPDSSSGIRIRPGYHTYDDYIKRQLNKTLNPKLRQIWTTRDWDRKIQVFTQFFSDLKTSGFLTNSSRSLCIGARMGQEVEALKRVGVNNSIGLDLVPSPPLVIQGDFHHQPFEKESFDLEFSNVFDHALYPEKFIGEIQRTLRPGGICVLHVAVTKRTDKYSANELFTVDPLVKMFDKSDLVRVRKIDGFGLDTELVFRKKEA